MSSPVRASSPSAGATLTTPFLSVPAISPSKQAGLNGNPLPSSSFSVAQCNVLRHATYIKWATAGTLDQSVRQLSTFRLTSYAADIVCLQEWSPVGDNEPMNTPNRIAEFRDSHTVLDDHLNHRAGVAIAFDHSKFSLVMSHYQDFGGGMKGCLIAALQLRQGPPNAEHPMVGVVSVHANFGTGKAAAELAKVQHLINSHYHFSRITQWVIAGDFNTDHKQQLLQTLGPAWTEANQANRPTHRSGKDLHVQYDFMFYKFATLMLHDFSIQPAVHEQLISHAVDQRNQSPPPFFSDHAILRSTFLFAKDS